MKMEDEYMLLDLDNVGFWELCRLLLDNNIGARTFINSHDDKGLHGTFFRRFLMFVSIFVICVLKLISRLMDRFGRFIESSLNLWSHYDSFLMLVFNTLRDTRMELDDEITHDDPRYVSALAIMASKSSYENQARIKKIVEDHWKMEHLGFYECSNAFDTKPLSEKKHPTQAFMFIDKTGDRDLIVISFRGTSPFSSDDWCTDLDFSWFRLQGIGKVHMGFMKALGLQKNSSGLPNNASWPKEIGEQWGDNEKTFAYYKIRHVLREKLDENPNSRFIVTGHSLGGALAVLFSAILRYHNEFKLLERLEGVYTFGQPRIGDDEFGRFMDDLLGAERYFRFVYANDIVPRIPFDDSNLLFKHFGHCYHFNSFYKGQVVNQEPNKNYFSTMSMGPMYLNAFFEVVRSAILPYAFGRNYKEGLLLVGVRLFGLIFPGLSAHCPQDYVNLTRLGSPDTFNTFQKDYSKERLLS